MAFVLILLFIIVLIFAFLPSYLPGLSRKLVDVVVTEDEEARQLKKQLQDLIQDLRSINMVDQFAKYAKTERKIKKLQEELSLHTTNKTDVFVKIKLGTNIAFHVIQIICFISIIWKLRSEPLLQMPEEWLSPVQKIIAFPSGVAGGIGVTFWLLVCRSVSQKAVQFVSR